MDVSLAEARNREKKDERDLLVVYQLCYFILYHRKINIYIFSKTPPARASEEEEKIVFIIASLR